MKVNILIEYEVEGSRDDARDVVNTVMAAVYNARTPTTPEAWTWELPEGQE